MSKALVFVSSHRRHIKVADRLVGALAAGRKIELISFERGNVDHPVYSDTNVSHTSLGHMRNGGSFSRLFALARAAWILFRARRRFAYTDTIVMVNTLEMLILSCLCRLTRFPTIYDVTDVRELQISKSILGRVTRRIEELALRRVDLLVVSSPWFYWEYFERWLRVHKPALLIENKVGFAQDNSVSSRQLTNRIAWTGLLRCQKSASVLLDCLQRAPAGSLHLSLHGSLDRLGALGRRLLKQPGCSYTGEYDPGSLGKLLATSSFNWAVDFADGKNSEWLLPNRLYEAITHTIPLIAVDGTATGAVVGRYNIGIVLPECTPQAVTHALETCDRQTYETWLSNLSTLKCRAARGKEWIRVFEDANAWADLKRLPDEVNVDVVLCAEVA